MDDVIAPAIMVIGNDSDFSYLMQRYARQSGHQIVIARPGEEALTLARRERPMVIVLETDVPERAGWDTLRALKADQATRDIPVVICSWLDKEARSLAEGAAGYLRKPVLYRDFLTALACAGQVTPPDAPDDENRCLDSRPR